MKVFDEIVFYDEAKANEVLEYFKGFGFDYITRNTICDKCDRPDLKKYPDYKVCRGIDLNDIYETRCGWIIG